MGDWTVKKYQKNLSINSPILIEGLPGIGNVGKVAVDYIIDQIKAKKIYSFFSYSMPHTVFINQNNLVELPEISIYHKRWHGKDYLFLAGDVQPVDEQGSYEFTDMILDIAQKFNVEEVITLGGIGMQDVPKQPKIYCTANTKKIVNKYKKVPENSKVSRVKVSEAMLGGGDIGFPLLFSGVILKTLGLNQALIVSLCSALALLFLFIIAEKKKFYPAMPILSLGCLIGYLVVKFLL